MKKKAVQDNQSSFTSFCSAQEKKAKISLIIASLFFVAVVGVVCAVAIRFNSEAGFPSENMELNAAEQYLSQVSAGVSEPESTEPSKAPDKAAATVTPVPKNLKAKRGHLTGARVVDISDLKSLSDEELVDAIISGTAGVIDRSNIETDQSQNQEVVHQGPEETAPTPAPSEVDKLVDFELGIDISEFNGNIDWNAVKADGISFAFIRCGGRGWGSEGKIYGDNKLVTNVNNAKAAGIKVGVYFFSQATTPYEALEEASFTLDKIKGLGINLPVVMDWETGSGYRTWDLYGQDFANVITSFCSTIAQNGYTPCVYLNTSDINNRLGGYAGGILSKYKLWYAYPYSVYDYNSSNYEHNYYMAGDTIPPRSFYFEYWQYSWHGRVSGISTDVDLNLRILGSTSLSEPVINVTNTEIVSAIGEKIDPMKGVTATSSQDQDKTSEVKYEIKNASDKAVTLEKAQQKAGKYTITYSFTDPFRGTVTASATWEVKADISPSPSISPEISTTPADKQETDPSATTTDPSTDPSADPSTDPSADPSTEPSADPSAEPSTDPSADPSTEPSADPSTEPSEEPGNETSETEPVLSDQPEEIEPVKPDSEPSAEPANEASESGDGNKQE